MALGATISTGTEARVAPESGLFDTNGVVMDLLWLLVVVFLVFLVAGWGWRSMRR